MAFKPTTYIKQSESYILALVEAEGAESEKVIFNVDELTGAIPDKEKELEITGIQWNSPSASTSIQFKWEHSSPSSSNADGITVYGNGKLGYDSFQGFKLVKPNEDYTGSITCTTSGACNFIIRILKVKGFEGGEI